MVSVVIFVLLKADIINCSLCLMTVHHFGNGLTPVTVRGLSLFGTRIAIDCPTVSVIVVLKSRRMISIITNTRTPSARTQSLIF